MKNLKVFSELKLFINLQSDGENLLFSVFDAEQNRIYFASSGNVIYGINLSSLQERQWALNLCFQEEAELKADEYVTALEYLMEQEALLVGTSVGTLLLLVPGSNTVEVVGNIDGGVKAISCSPDGALLAIATGLGQLLVMTQDWDVLYEVSYNLDSDTDSLMSEPSQDAIPGLLNPSSHVQISWRGDGKYFATLAGTKDILLPQKLRVWERDSGTLHSSSEPKIFMAHAMDWIPTGARIAAACRKSQSDDGTSVIFLERNGLERGTLDMHGPKEATIEMLKWNCNSELLAITIKHKMWSAVQIWHFSNYHWYLKQEWRYRNKERLMFSWDPERPMHAICWTASGLVHSLKLCWNSAVCDESTALVIDKMNVLLTPLSLALMPPPMSFLNIKFQSCVQTVAFMAKSSEFYLVASLSEGGLSIVKFPAMENWDKLEGITYESENIEVGDLMINFGDLRHLTWLDTNVFVGVFYCHSDETGTNANCTNDIWKMFPVMDERNEGSVLIEIELGMAVESINPESLSSSGWFVKSTMHTILRNSVTGIFANPLVKGSAFIQLGNGDLVLYNAREGISTAPAELYKEKLVTLKSFSSYCPLMQAVAAFDHGKLKALVFGLDEDGRLQVNGQMVCNSCTSFVFYSSSSGKSEEVITHLIYTTKQDTLCVVKIEEALHDGIPNDTDMVMKSGAKVRGKPNDIKEEQCDVLKVWERGAKLIGVVNGDEAAVILQTSRGNLETIYPRKLVLLAIAGAMVGKRFKDAISLVRQHRINYNILVDYCGLQNFIKISNEFVKQINNLNYITEFVCALKNENVMANLYKSISLPAYEGTNLETEAPFLLLGTPSNDFGEVPVQLAATSKNKVQVVLEAVRKALEEGVPKSKSRELCILTTLARDDPPALEEALKRIKRFREEEIAKTISDEGYACEDVMLTADEAVKHLLWLSDAGAVFEAALGLYDLHLAAIVALNSQRDPKEFLPFLQELEQMSPFVMRYTIDCKLKRYESALKSIAAAGDNHLEECLQLMKNIPNLFPLGLDLFKDVKKRSVIFELWGNHLSSEKKFEEAAMAYNSSGLLDKALTAFRAGGLWKESLTIAAMLNLPSSEISCLANELCEELQALGKPAEAAKIAIEYCNDIHAAVNLLITAREWLEALRIGFANQMGESLISQVKAAAIECANTLIAEYEEGIEKVGKYLARYLAVRQRRLLLAAKLQMESDRKEELEDDLASETSSNFSGMSAYTTGRVSIRSGISSSVGKGSSGKMRLKSNRKTHGGRIRAGSPGEEFALMEHIKSLALSSQAQEEVKLLSQTLVMLGEEETARKLQHFTTRYETCQVDAMKQLHYQEVEDSTTQKEKEKEKKCPSPNDTPSWKWQVLSRP